MNLLNMDSAKMTEIAQEIKRKRTITQAEHRAVEAVEKPTAPLTAYQLFLRATKTSLSGDIGDMAKEVTMRWAILDPAERHQYEEAAKVQKQSYEE